MAVSTESGRKILSLGKQSTVGVRNISGINNLLDGGGIRGLSSLVILKHVMQRVGAKMSPPKPNIQPYEYFDLIGGTSTGG
jgi:hypothetical protein